MDKIILDSTDATEEHNPFNERTIMFKDDLTFISDGRPYGKNTGKWSIDENTFELFLDSDAGEEDDSYWIIEFKNENRMIWKGNRSEFTERFKITLSRITDGKSKYNTSFNESGVFGRKEPDVRVQIISTLDTLHITTMAQWRAHNLNQSLSADYGNGDSLIVTITSRMINVQNISSDDVQLFDSLVFKSVDTAGVLEIENVPYGIGWWWAGEENRIYEGEIYIYPGDNNNPEVVVKLPLEEYLYGVVPYEIGGESPDEALKAQAVAARSEAVTALLSGMYSGPRHDLTSDVECQVFSGNKKRTDASDSAVTETRGLVISEKGKPINAYYSSNCGGHSELIRNVWPERPDPECYRTALSDAAERKLLDISSEVKARRWIESNPDVFCNPNLYVDLPDWSRENFRWKRECSAEEIAQMVAGDKDMGKLVNIIPIRRGTSGRINLAMFKFENDAIEIRGELAIRQIWQPALRSACFIVDREEDKFILRGAGWGHGVGMCQSGAVAQAKKGKEFISILQHYYPGVKLITMY
jgi:SpoIID/LytB domain protein